LISGASHSAQSSRRFAMRCHLRAMEILIDAGKSCLQPSKTSPELSLFISGFLDLRDSHRVFFFTANNLRLPFEE
jgi:hypothetical protein